MRFLPLFSVALALALVQPNAVNPAHGEQGGTPATQSPSRETLQQSIGVPLEVALTAPEEIIEVDAFVEVLVQVSALDDLSAVRLSFVTQGPIELWDEPKVPVGAMRAGETVEIPVLVHYLAEGSSALLVQALASGHNTALVNDRNLYERNEGLYTIFHSGRALTGMGGYLRLELLAVEEDYEAGLVTADEAIELAHSLKAPPVYTDQEELAHVEMTPEEAALTEDLRPLCAVGEEAIQAEPVLETKSAGTVTVQGTIRWLDENGGLHPSYGMTVQVRDDELIGSELVADVATGPNGEYYFVVDNDDGLGQGGRDIFVRIRTANSVVSIEDDVFPRDPYEAESAVHDNVPDGTVITWNFTCDNTGTGPACALHTGATYVAAYASILNGGSWLSHIPLRWPGETHAAYYNGSKINLRPGDQWDWDVMFHEYGHKVMDTFNFEDNPGGQHNIGDCISAVHTSKTHGIKMAWGEGWPTYFGTTGQDILNLASLNVPRVGDFSYSDTGESNFSYGLDTNSNDVGVPGDLDGLGEDNELAVQRILWDLYDTNSDSRDTVAVSHLTLFGIFASNHPETLSAAWAAIRSTLSNTDDLAYGAITTDHAVGPEPVNPAAGTLVGTANRSFSWTNGVGCNTTYDGDDWDLVFYDANTYAKIMTVAGLTTTSTTLDDGQVGTLASASHDVIWAVEGRYTGSPSTGPYLGDGFAITVNRPPVADADGPYNTVEGTDVPLTAAGSTDPDGDALTYEWDLDNDGSYDDATGQNPNFTMVGQDGVFTIGLRVSDGFGLSDTDTTTVTVTNEAPVVSFSSDQPKPEGAPLTITGTATDPGWLDTLTATVNWGDGGGPSALAGTLENSRPDATLSFTASHEYGDNGMYLVEVCANDDDTQTCDSIPVTINNVAPAVGIDAGQVTEINEAEFVNVLAHFSDPGWLDTYGSIISWGYGTWTDNPASLAITNQGGPGEGPDNPDVGTVTGTRQYGDNGSFTISVTVTDDDGGTGLDSFELTVHNVDPTATIDETHAIDVCGSPFFISHAGEDVDFSGRSTDPGSDDLDLSWDWDDGPPSPDVTTSYPVNVPAVGDDPGAPGWSPEVAPRDVTDAKTHAFEDACYYNVVFSVEDDDGGTAADDTRVIIAGNAELVRSAGYWYNQFRRQLFFTAEQLECYLAMVGQMSSVFSEVTGADSIADAAAMMHPSNSNGDIRVQFDRQLIAVWLNFANGAIEHDELVDTDFDDAPDTALLDVLCAAEAARIDDITTPNDTALEHWKDILEHINLMDENIS